MKKALKIIRRTLLGLLLLIYIAVAAVNYTLVQSYLGAAVSRYFSDDWGAEVRVGSLSVMPIDHLNLHEVLLVSPEGDTILDAESLRVQFRRFPLHGHGLDLQRVSLRNAYYHLESHQLEDQAKPVTNLQFIIDRYKKDRPKRAHKPFRVQVQTLLLQHVHYRMDLPDKRRVVYDRGVEVPHMEFYDIRGRIKDIDVLNDDVHARIVSLRAEERSGFVVNKIAGRVHVCSSEITAHGMEVETPKSHILCDAELHYEHWKTMKHYVSTVQHEVSIGEGTTVAMSDVAYWAPVLWGIDAQLQAEGSATGTIADLHTEHLGVSYGLGTSLQVAGSIVGLPRIDTTVIDLSHLSLRSDEADIQQLSAALGTRLPQAARTWIARAGYIDLQAHGRGGMNSLGEANISLVCALGNLNADARLRPEGRGLTADVEANSDGLGLQWIGTDWLTHSGIALSLSAQLADRNDPTTLNAEASVDLISPVVRGHRLEPISVSATLDRGLAKAELLCADSLAAMRLEATADLSQPTNRYTANGTIERLDAAALGLLPPHLGTIEARLQADLSGNSTDLMSGHVELSNLRVGEARQSSLTANLEADSTNNKRLQLACDALNATLSGRFAYADLPLIVRHAASEVLPSNIVAVQPLDSAERQRIADRKADFNILWTDNGSLLSALTGNANLASGTRISGNYNSTEQLKLVVHSDELSLGNLRLSNLGLSTRPAADGYVLDLQCHSLSSGNAELLSRIGIVLNSNPQRAMAELAWGDYNAPTHGDIMLRLHDELLTVLRPDFYIGTDRWTLGTDSLTISTTRGIAAKGITIANERQRIEAALSLCGTESDNLQLGFAHFDIGRLATLLLSNTPLAIGGTIDGHLAMRGLAATPYLNANLVIDSCIVNRQPLGNVRLRSNWNAELNTLNLSLEGDQIDAHGWMGLGRNNRDLNFAVDLDGLELAFVAPFLTAFSSRLEGRLHGTFDLLGTLDNPQVLGEAEVENGVLKVDITDVTYYFNDGVRIDNSTIILNDFHVLDPRGNIATIDGTVSYRGGQDIALDLQARTDNFLVLDKHRGEQFYGTVLAAAVADISGAINNLNIVVDARTQPGCTLTVPVSNQRQIKAQNFITFVSDEPTPTATSTAKKKKQGNLNLELDLNITPDVQLNLPMDFSEVSVKVGANGSGDLHLSLDGSNAPQVLGNYEFTGGTMKLSLLSLIDKNFTIESGSSLNFQGALPEARFDLRAVYSQRANLSTLTGSLSTVDNTQKYIQVEDVIAVSGTLQDPTIGFDLRLPNADKSVEDEVFAYIDRNSERDMLNQTLSLLISGQFYNASGSDAASAAGTAAGGGIGAIAATIGNALTDIVEFVDINVDYKSATEATNEQLDVNISRDWGRWYLESTLGYGGESRELETSSSKGAVLDALIGYRISPLVHVFAYNRTNNNDYTRIDLPYTQGVGLKLTKDFDTWAELLGKKKKNNPAK